MNGRMVHLGRLYGRLNEIAQRQKLIVFAVRVTEKRTGPHLLDPQVQEAFYNWLLGTQCVLCLFMAAQTSRAFDEVLGIGLDSHEEASMLKKWLRKVECHSTRLMLTSFVYRSKYDKENPRSMNAGFLCFSDLVNLQLFAPMACH